MRPDLSEVRRKQILEGATRYVARRGVEALTLEAVATEVGMSRSHIRHYMGNREQLIQALVEHLGNRYSEELLASLETVRPEDRLEAALDIMIGDYWDEQLPEDSAAIDALIAFSANNPEHGLTLLPYYLRIESILVETLQIGRPKSNPNVGAVAYAFLCLAFGNSSMRAMGFPRSRREAARTAIDTLIRQLLS